MLIKTQIDPTYNTWDQFEFLLTCLQPFFTPFLCASTWYDESVQTNFYWGMRVTLSNGVHSRSLHAMSKES